MNIKKNFKKHPYIYIALILLAFYMLKYFIIYYNRHDALVDQIHKLNLKSVQLLTGRFDFYNWELGDRLGEEPFKNCAEKRCFAFRSSSLIHIAEEKSDAIMVHGPNLWYMPNRQKYNRNPRQLWLFYSMEPQGLTFCSSHYKLTDLDDWFNLTATFKHDSSIHVDYKQFRDWSDVLLDMDYINEYKKLNDSNPAKSLTDLSIKNKKASVVWFVSHCETYSRRELYVKELLNYINIDIYGNCDKYFIPYSKKDPCASKKNVKCLNNLLNSYKFYLAFENSLCQDYITEKYWKLYDSDKIFNLNILPVVRGAREEEYKRDTKYENFYINSFNFKTPKELADYLNYLNKNNTAYLQYFKWKLDLYKAIERNIEINEKKRIFRTNWNVSTYFHLREPFCKLCSLLHNETYLQSKQNKVWKLSEWFSKQTNCWDSDETRVFLYKIVKFFGFCF